MNTWLRFVVLSSTTFGLSCAQSVAQTKPKPEVVLKGHRGAVSSVAISPDGKRIISGGEDGKVRIWDIEKRAEIQTLAGHKGQVLSVAFSPDGKRVASGGKDKTIIVWNTTDGSKVFTIADLKTPVTSVLFSQSGKWIFSTSGGPVVQVWDAAKGEPSRQSLAGHQSAVNCLSLSGDGKRMVTGTDDVEKHGGQIKVYELSNAHSSATLAGMVGAVNSVAFSPDATLIASASGDAGQAGELRVWETDENLSPIILTGHTGTIDCVAFSPDGKRVASGGADKVVRLWDPRKGSMVGTFIGHSSNVNSVAFSPDGKSIISGSSDGTVRIWDAKQSTPPLAAKGQAGKKAVSVPRRGNYSGIHDTPREVKVPVSTPLLTLTTKQQIMAVAFSPDGKRIVTGGRQATLTLWDAEKATEIRTFPRHENDIQGVAFSPDGLRIASASGDQTVRVWDAGNGKTVLTLKGFTPQVKGVAFAPDGKRIAGAGGGARKDATVQIWDASTGQLFRALKVEGEKGASITVSFSPDGKLIAADFSTIFPETGVIRIWEVEGGKLVQTLVGHSGNVWCTAFSPDGKHLVSSGGQRFHSGQIKVWDVETESEVLRLTGHRDEVHTVAFSPDGKRIASAGHDKIIKVWDAENGTEIGSLSGPKNSAIGMVSFSPDGQRILSIAANVAEIWNVDQAKPIPRQTEVAKKSAGARNQGRITIRGSTEALKGVRKFQEEQAAKQGITLPPGDGPVVIEDGQMRSVPLPRNRTRPNGAPMNNGQGGPGAPRPGVGRPGSPGGSGDSPVTLAERGNWSEAAAGYVRLFSRTKLNNGEPGFEYAAVTLLAGDVAAYRKICEDLVDRSGTQQIRPFHVARACTLAPNSTKDLEALEEKSNTELKRSNAYWSLTQQGALAYRAGRFDDAADLFERSLKSDSRPGIAVLNWLWLSMVETRRKHPQEARTWFD